MALLSLTCMVFFVTLENLVLVAIPGKTCKAFKEETAPDRVKKGIFPELSSTNSENVSP